MAMTAQVLPHHSTLPLDFASNLDSAHPLSHSTHHSSAMSAMDPAASAPLSPVEDGRGRRRVREGDDNAMDGDDMGDAGDGDGQDMPGTSRKRRRSRKGLDKKFECPHEGCGKSYSRAEHLYRHQLNHNPKQIYHCDFPDCRRSFVRQDLCARHKERHTARGSQLLRKDTFMHNMNPIVTAAMAPKNTKPADKSFVLQSPASAHPNADMSPPLDTAMQSPSSDSNPSLRGASILNRQSTDSAPYHPDSGRQYSMSGQSQTKGSFSGPRRAGSIGGTNVFSSMGNAPRSQLSPHETNENGFNRPHSQNQPSIGSYGSNSPYTPSPAQSQGGYGPPSQINANVNNSASYSQSAAPNYQPHQNFPAFSALPPPGFSTLNSSTNRRDSVPSFQGSSGGSNMSVERTTSNANVTTEGGLIDNAAPSYAMPVFGGEGYSRSPFAMADDFAAWLFNDSNFGPSASPMGYPGSNMQGVLGSSATIGLQAPYFNYDPVVSGYYPQPAPPQHPMAVNSILDSNLPESALSEEKRQQLLDLISVRFTEADHAPVKKIKMELFEGNRDDDHHVLSLRMMQLYIGSYWVHFHPQMPILHRPTFSATQCPDLLLLAIMALGACCLEKSHGFEVTEACAKLSNFLAWYLRWEIFMDADFRPPAKLWIFQALILLEIFEKMYSTRPLHERAHIHHATTLTLMRRGSSLIGRSALDSPPSIKSESKSGTNGTPGPNTPDEWWNHWITNEATRRAAFAAFLMDSLHATMFGHSAVMVAHEMRLPLPCDDALWSATSSAEVGRVEQSLHNNGIKPTTFLDGLKKTLNGQSVRTNSFGRAILMAGLLSVSWHMNQRDLQVSSLGVTQALGGRDKWRGSLTRAFDFWKQDFDQSLSKQNDQPNQNGGTVYTAIANENDFESRTVLHHLAHMAQHVDIVDCQIYAGATRLLGRSITPQDYNGAQRRMKEIWAPTARARDATFYALRFLSQVLVPQDHVASGSKHHVHGSDFEYSAREDILLNRPWVLYFATLIVWSYGYALDGPIVPPYPLPTHEDKVKDMQGYLRRIGGVRAPDDLTALPNRNACLGLLILMRDMFKKTRWQLLHEASILLSRCIEMLCPGTVVSP